METRRDILKKGAFVVPVILTLPAIASFASAASGRRGSGSDNQGQDNNSQN